MIERIEALLKHNREFVAERLRLDPEYFGKLADGQHPDFLWIGCSDSRVPPNRITGAELGEMFVHRNIANLVVQTDINLLSVLQYAVEVLKVSHVIVCGHYGCGGVKAAMENAHHGLIDNWLRTIRDTRDYFRDRLDPLDERERFDRLVDLNVVEQVYNLGKTSIIQNAWRAGGRPYIHGWVFDVRTGYIHPRTGTINNDAAMREICKFHAAVAAVAAG